MQLLVSVLDNAGEYVSLNVKCLRDVFPPVPQLESHFSSLLVLFFSTLDDNTHIAFNTIK